MGSNSSVIYTLIFDLDGTLIDSREDISEAANFALQRIGVPRVEPGSIWCRIGGGIRALLANFLKTQDQEIIEKAVTHFKEYYEVHCLDQTVLYEGVLEMLEHFRRVRKRMAVVSNKDQEYTDKILAGLRIAKYFHSSIGASAGSKKKPHPDLLHKAMEQLKNDPSETVIIGDSLADIEAGRSAGMKTCGVGYGIGEPEKIRQAKPDFWAGTPAELKELF